jgi:glycolate oxidase
VSLDVHRAIKAALDPAGLLNPGKVFRARATDLAAVAGLAPRRADLPAMPRG